MWNAPRNPLVRHELDGHYNRSPSRMSRVSGMYSSIGEYAVRLLVRSRRVVADRELLHVRRAPDIGEMVIEGERPDVADEAQSGGTASTPVSSTAQPKRQKAKSKRRKATRARDWEDWASDPPRTRSHSGAAAVVTRFDKASGGAIVDKRRKR